MQLALYTVFDSKAQKFGTPFFQQNDLIATRSFTRAVNDPQPISTHFLRFHALLRRSVRRSIRSTLGPSPAAARLHRS